MGRDASPPSPKGLPVLGNTFAYASDQFGFIEDARRECGDVFVADLLGLGKICYLTHPDHFERVLGTDRDAFGKSDLLSFALGDGLLAVEGDRWERQREALEAFFYPERIRSYADRMVTVTERRIDRWQDGETRSLLEEMTGLALEILFETLFDRRLDPDVDVALRQAATDLNAYFEPTSLVLPRWLPTPSRRRFDRADDRLRAELRSLLEDRAGSGQHGDDLLSTLVTLRETDTAPMSDDEILDQLMTLLFAGHETSALALTYALYELHQSDPVCERFTEELATVLDGERPTTETVPELSMTRRIVQEALRMYPPAHTIPRVTTRDVELGGYTLPEGTRTHLALHSVHSDERFYDDPDVFRPTRWQVTSPTEKGYAYLPFGAGPRTCIGRQFALLEARLALATIGQQYRLVPQSELSLSPMMSTQPVGEVPVTVRRRG